MAGRGLRLPGHGIPRLALRLRVPAASSRSLFFVAVAVPTAVPRAHHLGRRDRDAAARSQAMEPYLPAADPARLADAGASGSSRRSAARPTGSSPRAPPGGSCGGLARDRPLRAEQDGPRDARVRPSRATGWLAPHGLRLDTGERSKVRSALAGWSSPVARWAHNPKVAGSNPAPATKTDEGLAGTLG